MIKKVAIAIIISALIAVAGNAYARQDPQLNVPRVSYNSPKDQSTVDLTGKKTLTFSWNVVPTPSGGRESFRFKLYKGFDYGSIVSQNLDNRTFSIDVPADNFVDGQTYTWRVQQRGSNSMTWSLYDTWSFKVVKKQ
jgi:hypothetical protein